MKHNCLKPAILLFMGLFCLFTAKAQNICNPNGNLIIFTNYDGGVLNIDVDQNIPNLVIGVVGYEATSINLTGAFLSNVTAVHYAGYNGTNNPCGGVLNTTINGAPVGAATSTVFAPTATLSNINGYGMIICGYSCSNNTNQGGCNTVDQIEAYFAGFYPGSALFAHMVQYNCWSGTYSVSAGGSCCPANPLVPGSIAGSQSVCANGTVTPFTSVTLASGGTGPITYQWEFSTTSSSAGFSNITGANGAGFSPAPVGVTTWFRRGAGTSINPPVYSNVLMVTVPAYSVTVSAPVAACVPAMVSLTANSPGAVSYSWMGPNGPYVSMPTIAVIVTQSVNTVFSVTATQANGCTATNTVQVIVAPSPTVTAAGAMACVGQSALLTAGGAVTYTWTGPSGYTATGATASLSSVFLAYSGLYTVTGSLGQCNSSATASLMVVPLPIVNILNSPSATVIYKGNSIELIAYGESTSYTWTGATPSGTNSAVAAPLTSTNVLVQGSFMGCVSQPPTVVYISVDACTSIDQLANTSTQLLVYPNPAQGAFTVRAGSPLQLQLVNALGQLVRVFALDERNAYRAEISGLEEGVYYLVSPGEPVIRGQKIIIQK